MTYTFTSLHFKKKINTFTPLHLPEHPRYSLQNKKERDRQKRLEKEGRSKSSRAGAQDIKQMNEWWE